MVLSSVAIDAGGPLENHPARGDLWVLRLRRLLLAYPAIEILRRVNINAQQHLRVLRAAILRALSDEKAGALRLNPHLILTIRNEVRLARQPRHPKTVHDVRRAQIEEGRQPFSGLLTGTCSSLAVTMPSFG